MFPWVRAMSTRTALVQSRNSHIRSCSHVSQRVPPQEHVIPQFLGGFEEKCNGQPPFLWGMIGGIVQSALNFVFWGGILKCPRIAQSLSNHHHFPITIIFQSPSAHFPTRHWTRGSRLGSLLLPVVKSRPTYWHHLPGFVISSNNNDKYMYI